MSNRGGAGVQTGEAATPRAAATAILLREHAGELEVLLLERSDESPIFPGFLVFPGGRVEDHDIAPQLPAAGAEAQESARRCASARVCAVRETLEEVGVHCIDTDGAVTIVRGRPLAEYMHAREIARRIDALTRLSCWATPRSEARRFEVAFYLGRADANAKIQVDPREVKSARFAAPRAVLADCELRRVKLAPPTHHTLSWLARQPSVHAALEAAAALPLATLTPQVLRVGHADRSAEVVLPGDPEFVSDGHSGGNAPPNAWPLPHRYHVADGCVQPGARG